MLDVGGSLCLFGGLTSLLGLIQSELQQTESAQPDQEQTVPALQFTRHLVAAAPYARLAWWLASWAQHTDTAPLCVATVQNAQDTLPTIPLCAIDAAQTHLHTLHRCGLHTLGQLMELPRPGIARRFGQALLDAVDQASGVMPCVLTWIVPPLHFRQQADVPFHTHASEALLRVMSIQLEQLSNWLAERLLATHTVRFTFAHDHTPPTVWVVRSANPYHSAAPWMVLLREQFVRQPLTDEIISIELQVTDCVNQSLTSDSLLIDARTPAQDAAQLHELFERLQARLGAHHVQGFIEHPDARPEYTQSVITASPLTHRPLLPRTRLSRRALKPLWLLEQPERLQVRHTHPHRSGPLALLAGPERIEFGWWNNHPVRRDYYIAQDSDASQLWIYQELDTKHDPQGRRLTGHWFVHGLFA